VPQRSRRINFEATVYVEILRALPALKVAKLSASDYGRRAKRTTTRLFRNAGGWLGGGVGESLDGRDRDKEELNLWLRGFCEDGI
jgi:hypothetical protein